jgi:antitoxin (DNA-binding transcriptional repressor) of toxin-antitoxin stability system
VKEISATEAARGFAEMLDAIEHEGETFLVRRNGRAVARIEPAAGATGGAVKDLLTNTPPDPEWIQDLRTLRSGLPAEVSRWDG